MTTPLLTLLSPLSHLTTLFQTLFPRNPGKIPLVLTEHGLQDAREHCERVGDAQLKYCEDLLIWHRARAAIISADSSRATFNAFTGEGIHNDDHQGQLWIFNLDTQAILPLHLSDWPKDRPLHTLGLGILELDDEQGQGRAILAAANFSQTAASIELFDLSYTPSSGITAKHYAILEHPDLTSPNAVIPLSRTQVIFTQSYGLSPRKHPFFAKIEQAAAFPGGSLKVATQDTTETTCLTLVKNISMANGLAMNDRKTIIAVAGCTSRNVHIYDVAGIKETGGLSSADQIKYRKTVPVSYLPDNLSFIQDRENGTETILSAGHPDALCFLKTAQKPTVYRAPSRVTRITIKSHPDDDYYSFGTKFMNLFAAQGGEATTIFQSLGDYFATSSTAAAYKTASSKDEVLICGLWEDGILVCKDITL